MNNQVLPEGWVSAEVEEIVEAKYGKGLPDGKRRHGRVPVYGSNGVVGWHDRPITKGPAIIIGRKGTVGAVNVSDCSCWPIDTTYFVDEVGPLDIKYLFYSLSSLGLSEFDTSTAIPGLNRTDLYSQGLLLPPVAEQKRIVARVERLLAPVNAARERLAKVPGILKRFRQSVLAAACSGRLTADWREQHPDVEPASDLLERLLEERPRKCRVDVKGTYRHPAPPEPNEGEIPPNWTLASMEQLSTLATSGSRGWAKYYSDTGPIFIRAQDINTDMLNLDNVAHVNPPANSEGRRTRVKRGDLLVTITGANVTKSAAVDADIPEAYVSQHVALVRLVEPNMRDFLHLWLISPAHGRDQLLKAAYGMGKPGLNLSNIREVTVALPPFLEQKEIVRRVQAFLKLADAIEARVVAAREKAEKLTQAILAKAFRGELVPTEAELARREGREYEPASALLERIRAERAKGEASERKRCSKPGGSKKT